MSSYLKRLTAVSLAAFLALNLAGVNTYAEESGSEEPTVNATPFVADEEQSKSDDENIPSETDSETGTSDAEETQDPIDNEDIVDEGIVDKGIVDEGIVDKQIITGFADLDESIFTVDEKLPIEKLGLPEQLPVYINGSAEVVYIAVTWECADYENTKYERYTFTPVWDVNSYEIALDLDSSAVPVIEVIVNIFDFENGIIKGLKDTYLSSLTAEQKKNINLVIPESINSQPVTAIGTNAFSLLNNPIIKEDCEFIGLDFSKASNLKIIGNGAFQNCHINQSLILPENLKTIGNDAFRLGENRIGFTGKLLIPENVTSIGAMSFSGQRGLTSVEFTGNKITELPNSVFRYCSGLSGVLKIPDSVKKIGENTFTETNITTLYLPKLSDKSSQLLLSNSFKSNKLNAIVCHSEDYDTIKNWVGGLSSKLGYEITINFETYGEGNFEPITRLFNRTYDMVKNSDGQWLVTNYKLPQVEGKKWRNKLTSITPLTGRHVISSDTLYLFSPYEDPVITYSEDIEKTYDGQPITLTVTASHPLAKPYKEASEGDVVFKYTWHWATIGSSSNVLQDFDKNVYSFSDVRDSTQTIICTVKIQGYVRLNGSSIQFYTEEHDFKIFMHQANPIVNPVYSTHIVDINGTLPDIKLSEGDTPGTIVWDSGQTLKEGTHEYKWTYTPEINKEGRYNYKSIKGSTKLFASNGDAYIVTTGDSENGSIILDKPYGALKGEDIAITFKPNSGYKLSSALLDNTDIFDKVSDNKYTIRDIQSNHTLDASFTSMETKDVEDVIESLPDIKDVVTNEEVKNDILDAKLHYDAVTKDSDDISEEAKEKMYEAISKLDQVETVITTTGNVTNNIIVDNDVPLLENMETEDAEVLKNSNTTSLKIELVVDAAPIDDDKQNLIDSVLGDAVVGDSFDVTVIKKLIDNNSVTKETQLKELKKPIQLVFDIPSNLPAIEQGYVREFSIIRLHTTLSGQIIPEVLKDEDSFEDSISVSSDKFSTYIIVYKDVKKQDGSQGGGSGSYFKTYTIRFETFGGSSIDSITDVKTGKKINAPAEPKRKGYIFKGWYIDQACTELWDFSKNAVTSNLTLYAGWEKVAEKQTFNIVFNSMGGSAVDEMNGIAAGETVNVSVTPVKEGYTFKGWYIDKACTIPWDTTVNDNLTLYAGWNKNEIERQSYLIVFESNNGDSTLTEYLPAGDKLSMPEAPVREGYTFIGWFVDEECTIPWQLDTAVNSNVTLYAGWKETERQIHLVISEETAEKKSDNIKVTEGKKAEMPKEPVKEGYVFKGWFTDKECTIPFDFNSDVVEEDMTLYAGWEKVDEKKETNEQPEKEPTVSNETNNTTVLTVSALAAVTALIACVFVFKRKKNK